MFVDYVSMVPGNGEQDFEVAGYDKRVISAGAVEWVRDGWSMLLIPMAQIRTISTSIEER